MDHNRGMYVRELMTADPLSVAADLGVDDALALLEDRGLRHLLVTEDGRLVGVLSDRDMLSAMGGLPRRVHACRGPGVDEQLPKVVAEIMTPAPITAAPDDDVATLVLALVDRDIGCVPVVASGRPVGIVTEADLLAACATGEARVGDCMTRDPITVGWFSTLAEVLSLCERHRLHHLPVLEAGNLVGLVSDRDARRAVGAGRRDDTPVEGLMAVELATTTEKEPLHRAAEIMRKKRIGALPVTENGRLVGIVSRSDVFRHWLRVRGG